MDNFYFLNALKTFRDATLWGSTFRFFDFYTSSTMPMIEKDIEEDILKTRKKLLELQPKTIVDLGANVGMWALPVAKLFPESIIHAVEVAPYNAKNLALALDENKIKNVVIHEVGVGKTHEKRRFYQHPLNSGGCFMEPANDFPSFETEIVPLDDLIESWGKIDFMKVDIERAEFETFAAFTKWDQVGAIAIEIHGNPEEETADEKKMEELYFLLASKLGPKNVSAICYKRSFFWGEEIPWGSLHARLEAEKEGRTL